VTVCGCATAGRVLSEANNSSFHVSIRIDRGLVSAAVPVCAACQVPINLSNAHAFILSTAVRVVTSTYV